MCVCVVTKVEPTWISLFFRHAPAPETLEANRSTHDRDVLEQNVKLPRPGQQVLPDLCRDDLSLGDQFRRVELSDGGLQDFVTDGGEDSLVVAAQESRCESSSVRGDAKGKV